MAKKLLFISLANDYWDGIVMSRHQVMKRLAQNHKVLFVSPRFNIREVIDDLGKRKLKKGGVIIENENLFSIIPPKFFPEIYFRKSLDNISMFFFVQYLKYLIRKIDHDKLILYIWNPRFFDFIGKLGEDLVCYHVHDQYKGYAGTLDSEAYHIDKSEKHIMKNAHIVFANGDKLLNEKKPFNENIYNIPSGVDYPLYENIFENGCEIPVEMKDIPGPKIGHIGILTCKIDIDLLIYMADERKNYSFVLLGPVILNESLEVKFQDLISRSNVYYIPKKPANDLPRYINALDVCIMAYRLYEHTNFGYPLKLYEYLALGKPAIGPDMECFYHLTDIMKIAKTNAEWVSHIDDYLKEEDSLDIINKRRTIAAQNGWDDRVDKILNFIFEELELI